VSGHFSTSAEVSCGQFGTGVEVFWVRSVLGSKCLGSEVSWVRMSAYRRDTHSQSSKRLNNIRYYPTLLCFSTKHIHI